MRVRWDSFGRALRNPLRIATPEAVRVDITGL